MEISEALFRPIGFTPSRKDLNKTDYKKEQAIWLKKNPSSVQKMNFLTLGGFIVSTIGGLLALFSEKGGKAFGALLTFIGLGGAGTGILKASDPNNEEEVSTTDKPNSDIVPKETDNPKVKKKKNPKPDNLKNLSVEELVAIVKNEVGDKKYTYSDRVKAAQKIAEKGLEEIKEATKSLVQWLKDNVATSRIKKVAEGVRSALRRIGDKALEEVVKPDSSKNEIGKLAKSIIDEIMKVIKIKTPKPVS